jgi:hypothetical protein
MLIDRRDKEGGVPERSTYLGTMQNPGYERKRIVVSDIADYMVRNHAAVLGIARLREISEATFQTFYNVSFDPSFIEYLVERSGLLRQEEFNRVGFIHNTFRDYLAAIRLVLRRDYGFLVEHAFKREWQNVVLFACGAVDGQGIAEILKPMISRLDNARKKIKSNRENSFEWRAIGLFILRCATVALELPSELHGEVKRLSEMFLPPQDIEEAHVLAATGDQIAASLKYDSALNVNEQVASVRTLGMMGSPKAQTILRSYLSASRAAVREEIVRYINPLEVEVYRGVVTSGKQLPDEIAARVVDLAPLANLHSDISQLNLAKCYIVDIS